MLRLLGIGGILAAIGVKGPSWAAAAEGSGYWTVTCAVRALLVFPSPSVAVTVTV